MRARTPLISSCVAKANAFRAKVLAFVNEHEGQVTTGDVARAFGVSMGAAGGALNYLSGRGLINVVRHPPFKWSKKQ